MKEVNDNIFVEEVENSEGVVVVDFWAPWCGPCKMLTPVMEDLSKDMEGKAQIVKLNVDESPVISNKYRITSIPTVVVFKDGKVVETAMGFRPKDALSQMIEKHL